MQEIKVKELIPHPRNEEFFDNITGEAWKEFLKSIETSGVIEPLIVSHDKVIVSGNQRNRACIELGIDTVSCEVRIYDSEDKMLKDLLETNIRQRGIGNPNPVKFGRCIKELERIYGIRNGGDRKSVPNNSDVVSQSDLAEMAGVSVDTLNNYKKLTTLLPEIQDLIDTGIVTPTTAIAIARNMSDSEQEELISSLDTTKKITKKEVEKYIQENKELKEKAIKAENKAIQLETELKERPEVKVEVVPDDYSMVKKYLVNSTKECDLLQRDLKKRNQLIEELRMEIDTIKTPTEREKFDKKLKDSTLFFCSSVASFIQENGGYIWLTEHINELPDYEKKSFVHAVNAMQSWVESMQNGIQFN